VIVTGITIIAVVSLLITSSLLLRHFETISGQHLQPLYIDSSKSIIDDYWKNKGPNNRGNRFADSAAAINHNMNLGRMKYTERDVVKLLGQPDLLAKDKSERFLIYMYNVQARKDYFFIFGFRSDNTLYIVGANSVADGITGQLMSKSTTTYSAPDAK
jgi:hypothetical protein